jgi:SAM-dependent methyltransferase
MGFSNQWNEQYRDNNHMSIWPWSKLVSLTMRMTDLRKANDDFAVMEVGCGAGANIPFFAAYTKTIYAIEGSAFIVNILKERFPQIAKNIFTGDFAKEWPVDKQFDLIVDRAASTHNTTPAIKEYLVQAHKHLNDDGILIITDWFSTEHNCFSYGEPTDDEYTKSDYETGPFANVGNVHYFNRKLIAELIADFELLHIEHLTSQVEGEDGAHACWNLVLKKRQ